MSQVSPVIETSWKQLLQDEFSKEYFSLLKEFLVAEKKMYRIYPKGENIFAAFNHTPVSRVRVVILGQDPYHGPGQAHGLCFSVPNGVEAPPSLKNIFLELNRSTGKPIPASGNLSHWAEQGVLLLNATLTVREHQAGSHQGKGWETFTDAVIAKLSEQQQPMVFMLWGNYARSKKTLIRNGNHLILEAPHPSPLSAHRGFLGCGHFKLANEFLVRNGQSSIAW